MADIIQFRRGTSAYWTAVNPVLAQGEPALEIDTLKEKIGDGVTAWNDLGYKGGGDVTWSQIQGPQSSINLSGFTDDIGATDAFYANRIFIDTVNGNDATAVLENRNKPYKTVASAFANMPDSAWVFHFLNAAVVTIAEALPSAFRAESDVAVTLDLANNNSLNKGFNTSTPSMYINLPNGKLKFGNGQPLNVRCAVFELKANELIMDTQSQSIGSRGFIRGVKTKVDVDILTITTNCTSGVFCIMNGIDVKIGSLNCASGGRLTNQGGSGSDFSKISIGSITVGGGQLTLCESNPHWEEISIGNISGSGTVLVSSNSLTKEIYVNFQNSIIRGVALQLMNRPKCPHYFSGKVNIDSVVNVTPYTEDIADVYFVNFSAIVHPIRYCRLINYTFESCTLEFANHLFDPSGNEEIKMNLKGFNTFISQNENQESLFENTFPNNSIVPIKIYGTVKTNVKSFGLNIEAEYLSATFKEKISETVVRSKIDIVNRVLDTHINYLIDGTIELLAGEFIIVPPGGNLTINGYGLELSTIVKNVAGESIFTSPMGGSGGLQMEAIKFIMGTPTTSCFDLTDETSFNAVECIKVNFEGSGNIGKLNGYRQGLWSNIGLFGISDGLTPEGSWRGGIVTDKVIARNLSGTTGSIFRKGTALTIASRFSFDGNIDIPAGWSIADFDTTNFINPKTFQVQNAVVTRAGVFDDTDALYFPNINEEDTASDWKGNNGVKNSSLSFEKLRAPNGNVYKVEVDNSGVITTTLI